MPHSKAAPAGARASVLDTIGSVLHTHDLRSQRLLVGVSGGGDSLLLMEALARLQQDWQLQIQVVHIDHQLRGADSAADASWVAQAASERHLPYRVFHVDAAAQAAAEGDGIEAAARRLRYECFQTAARDYAARALLLAHHQDDQIETILHHLLRGSGLAGLAGMPASRPLAKDLDTILLRPMLTLSRIQIEDTLNQWDLTPRHDSSNADLSFTRNRIRNELIPLLESQYQSQLGSILLTLSEQSQAAQSALEWTANHWLDQALEDQTADYCRLARSVLLELPRHLQRECFRQLWMRQNWPRQRMGFVEWDRLSDALQQQSSWDFPDGIRVEHRGELMVVQRKSTAP